MTIEERSNDIGRLQAGTLGLQVKIRAYRIIFSIQIYYLCVMGPTIHMQR